MANNPARSVTAERERTAQALREEGMSDAQIGIRLGVDRTTIVKMLKRVHDRIQTALHNDAASSGTDELDTENAAAALEAPVSTPSLSGNRRFGMFASLEGLGAKQQLDSNTRFFQGDGSHYLLTPGLRKLTGIRLGSMDMPLTITQRYQTDLIGNFYDETVPLVIMDTLPDGTPVLLRNVQSNDGIWQVGQIYVTGEWDSQAAQATA